MGAVARLFNSEQDWLKTGNMVERQKPSQFGLDGREWVDQEKDGTERQQRKSHIRRVERLLGGRGGRRQNRRLIRPEPHQDFGYLMHSPDSN